MKNSSRWRRGWFCKIRAGENQSGTNFYRLRSTFNKIRSQSAKVGLRSIFTLICLVDYWKISLLETGYHLCTYSNPCIVLFRGTQYNLKLVPCRA